MGLPKGRTNNPNGRTVGSKNKVSIRMKEKLEQFCNQNWDIIVQDFKSVEAKERLYFFEKILSFIISKPSPERQIIEPINKKLPAWMELDGKGVTDV